MADTAKLFMHGRSQAVRLPKAFRMPGTEVRVTKVGNRVILEPMTPESTTTPWDVIDSLGDRPFMPDGREQPEMLAARLSLDKSGRADLDATRT